MFKKESIRNYIVRFLCAILLLMVQMDVLACDVCGVSLCSEIEWVQTDAGEMQGEVCVDDYYRQLPRPSARTMVALLPALALLPNLFSTIQKEEVIFPIYYPILPEGLNAQTVYCVFRI